MILYHFTSRYHLPLILEHGLSRGDVPLSPTLSTQAVNLTREGRAHKQKYNRTSYFLYMGQRHQFDKAEIRISVDIDTDDPLLIHWPVLTHKMNMAKAWLDHLHRKAEESGDAWYLYFGTIQPNQFKIVEVNARGNGVWKDLNTLSEPLRLVTDKLIFKTSSEVEGREITRIPQDEFVKGYL